MSTPNPQENAQAYPHFPQGQGPGHQSYPQQPLPAPGYLPLQASKSKVAAALLAFFLGGYGAHNFYLGYMKKAWWQLGLTLFGYITAIFVIGLAVIIGVGIWAFVEFILILVGGGSYATDAKGLPMRN